MTDDNKAPEYDMPHAESWDQAPGEFIEAGIVARAGDPLAEGARISDKEEVAEALRTVYDPEIPVNIYELGLVYAIEIGDGGKTHIDMTLTAPGCPVAGILPQQVADAAASVPGIGEVEVNLVWDPPWDMDKMSDEAKVALGLY